MPEFKKKSVRFDHLEPTYTSYSTQSEIQTYDLEDMLKQIARAESMDTKKIIDGDSYIFHVCKYHDEDNLWELRVLRIREKILPGILHDDGTYELIKLGNDEVTAESTTLAYAPATHTLYMQRNRFGISIRNMEAYLTELSPKDTVVILAVKEAKAGLLRLTEEANYRKVIMSAEINPFDELPKESLMKDFLNATRKARSQFCRVELRVSRGKNNTLDAQEAVSFIKEALGYSGTRKLDVVIEDKEDCEVETIDLLSNVAKYVLPFNYSMSNPITHERLYFNLKSEIIKDEK